MTYLLMRGLQVGGMPDVTLFAVSYVSDCICHVVVEPVHEAAEYGRLVFDRCGCFLSSGRLL